MSFEYVTQYYGVPACYGRLVKVYGKPGIIIKDRGNYIGVNFDDDKPGHVLNAHPVDGVEYLGIGTPRKMTRSQQRYRDYIDSEFGGSFADWLGIQPKRLTW
jgi:hypothetical protein